MADGVEGDVADVMVDERVAGLASDSIAAHQSLGAQDGQVLRHGGLGKPEQVDELVDAPVVCGEVDHDPEPSRVSECSEQSRCGDHVVVDGVVVGRAVGGHGRIGGGRWHAGTNIYEVRYVSTGGMVDVVSRST